MRTIAFSSLLALCMACGASSSNDAPGPSEMSTPDAAPASPTPDAAADAPPAYLACADATTPGDLACGKLAWSKSHVPAARARNHHVTEIVQAADGPYLYEIAGFNAVADYANVDAAPIAADGTVGKWKSQAALPMAMAGSTGGVVGNVIVVAGGNTGLFITDASYSAVVGDGGAVTAWKSGPAMVHPRMHSGSVVTGTTLYVMGGFDGNSEWNDVAKATVSPDGTISAWESAGTLPSPLSHFSVAVSGDYVYVAGGLNTNPEGNPPGLAGVYRGVIAADGTLGSWTDMPQLPVALCTHASFVYGGYLYVAGGIAGVDTASENKRAWRTPIGAAGALGAWEPVASLLVARGHVHQLPVFQNHVYSVAGAIDFNLDSTSELDIGTFQ